MRSVHEFVVPRAVNVCMLLCICCALALPSGRNEDTRISGTLTNESYRPFLINNVFNYYGNNGGGSYNTFSQDHEGFEFPKGSGKWVMYEDGLVWGGHHKGRATPKVGGSVYLHALQAGPLLTGGTPSADPVPANAADPHHRLYRVRPDVRPGLPPSSVEAILDAEEVPYISRYETVTAQLLYDRYVADWNEWPAADGAPFTDVDKNGTYDPAVDIPGQPGADQTLWYVANDMNDSLTQRLAGCPPIGIEIHRTIWGYRRDGALGNTIFISTVLINKSGAPVDSMYIAQWADPDLGNAGDDFVGCDTTLDLGYVYNGLAADTEYGNAVPAGGFALIQGPVAPGAPSDTAMFLGSRRPGFRNLRMTAFSLYHDGRAEFGDPSQGKNGDVEWYQVMKGLPARGVKPFVDPLTGDTTRFCASGDPVTSTDGRAGWVDGMNFAVPQDRRMCMATGPFTLASGDTQQIIVACLVSQGTDRLSSITKLRADTRAVRSAFRNTFLNRQAPVVSCAVRRDTTNAEITFRVDPRRPDITSASVMLMTFSGVPIASTDLGDDGRYGDHAVADGVWGGVVAIPAMPSGLRTDLHVTYVGGEAVTWENVLEPIATAPLTLTSSAVASDNLNSNGIANPGENVRYVCAVRNDAPFDLRNLVTRPIPVAGNADHAIGTLASHATFALQYDAADPATYFSFDVPVGYADSTFRVAIVTTDDSMNFWQDTLVFPVKVPPEGSYRTPTAHVSGWASGAYSIAIVDPARVKTHLYVLRGGSGQAGPGSYTLKDSTTGAILLQDHPVPDTLGHTSPVVDGFKILRGTTMSTPGMRSWSLPHGDLRFSPVGGFTGLGLEGFSDAAVPLAYDPARGTIGAAMNFTFAKIRTGLTIKDCHTVLLRLAAVDNQALWDPLAAPADPNISRGYRYLRASADAAAQPSFVPWIINKAFGYPYQDYNYSVPFSAWDIDVDPPQRLAVGHLESNTAAGKVDGRYWPGDTNADNRAVREFAFIFGFPYTDTPDPSMMVNLMNDATTPLMWVMTCSRSREEPWPGDDEFVIVAHHFPSPLDTWVFNPSVIMGMSPTDTPSSFALLQNYPNPFNPSTTIHYELPVQSEVTITVYDVLGRAVRHLVRDVQPAGSHAVLWHADTDTGGSVASGVYFYRCTVEQSDRGGRFDQTMKMIVLR